MHQWKGEDCISQGSQPYQKNTLNAFQFFAQRVRASLPQPLPHQSA
jgi:hypothetical protein